MSVPSKVEDQILQTFVQQPGYRNVVILKMISGEIVRSVGLNDYNGDLKQFIPLILDFFTKIKNQTIEMPEELEINFPSMEVYVKILPNTDRFDYNLVIVSMWPNTITYRHDVELLIKRLHFLKGYS